MLWREESCTIQPGVGNHQSAVKKDFCGSGIPTRTQPLALPIQGFSSGGQVMATKESGSNLTVSLPSISPSTFPIAVQENFDKRDKKKHR
jgi:hypothetical protein